MNADVADRASEVTQLAPLAVPETRSSDPQERCRRLAA
jgi:hypothetical protein